MDGLSVVARKVADHWDTQPTPVSVVRGRARHFPGQELGSHLVRISSGQADRTRALISPRAAKVMTHGAGVFAVARAVFLKTSK